MKRNIQPRVVSCQQLSVVSDARNMQLMVALNKNEQFSIRLNKLLDLQGAPDRNSGRARWLHDFVKKELKIDISYEATRKWLSGDAMPYVKRIGAIAKSLNSTTEYLIGETDDHENHHTNKQMGVHENHHTNKQMGVKEYSAPYSTDDVELLERIHQLSDADRARLAGIIDALDPKLDKKAN